MFPTHIRIDQHSILRRPMEFVLPSLPAFEKIFRENREIIENSQESRKNQVNQEIFKKNFRHFLRFLDYCEFGKISEKPEN